MSDFKESLPVSIAAPTRRRREPLWRCIIASLALIFFVGAAEARPPSPTYEFTGGAWFDGNGFVVRTMYVHDGRLWTTKPGRIDEVIDIQGKFVIPPLGEAHNHWLEPKLIDAYNAEYLRDGVFYVRDMANAPAIVDQFRDRVNLPTSVDFVSALQGFTGPRAHPLEVLLAIQQFGILPKEWRASDFDLKAEMVVTTPQSIRPHLDALLQHDPALVKAFLEYSEEFGSPAYQNAPAAKRGMDPALLPELVRQAHARGLRVAVHVYSVADFHVALKSGADEIAHMPGIGYDPHLGIRHFLISDADATLAAQRRVPVDTTLSWLQVDYADDPKMQEFVRTRVVLPNIAMLKRHGVKLLLGTDQFRQDSLMELMVLHRLGAFSNLELLRMACEDTPRAIFPARAIGRLQPGFEASFLVLEADPLTDLDNIKRIALRVKDGHRIDPATLTTPMPPLPK